ncbi:hypothetical protein [Rhizobium brockwellii]
MSDWNVGDTGKTTMSLELKSEGKTMVLAPGYRVRVLEVHKDMLTVEPAEDIHGFKGFRGLIPVEDVDGGN